MNAAADALDRVRERLGQCPHPAGHIMKGPSIPLRWGSAATQVCGVCKAWRRTPHIASTMVERWNAGDTLAEALVEDEEI